MPSAKVPTALKLNPILVGNKHVGFELIGTFMFDQHFANEKEGNIWDQPLSARGENGVLAKHLLVINQKGQVVDITDAYKQQPLIKNPNGKVYVNGRDTDAMYVKKDFSLGVPFEGRQVPADYVGITQQATAHADFSESIINPTVLWPDGKARKLRVQIKANNAMTPDEIDERREQATQKRLTTMASKSPEAVNLLLTDKLIAGMHGKDPASIRNVLQVSGLAVPDGEKYNWLREEGEPAA